MLVEMRKKNSRCNREDCEITLTMRVQRKRGQVIAAFVLISWIMNLAFTALYNRPHDIMYAESLTYKVPLLASQGSLENNSHAELRSPWRRSKRRRGLRLRRPEIQPNPKSLSANSTFSACLLIKDDNEILNEWLAYHYFVLKLRHLIVAVDPLSSESPSMILQKWQSITDLEVIEWSDPNYMPHEFLEKGHPPRHEMQKDSDFEETLMASDLLEISNHRYRQRVFLAQCMKKHRQLGHSWVVHIDTDEYVVASKLLRQMRPDYVSIPPMDQPGSVLTLLQQVVEKTHSLLNYPCISMLRVIFGSVESHKEFRDQKVPEFYNSTAFETMRWRYHGLPHNMSIHGNPKVILDVAAIPEHYFSDVVFSIHRPVMALCSRNSDLIFSSFRRQPIAVNHYLGSWERYSGRQDKRRSREKYDAKANQRRGTDDGIRPWLRGFVETVGDQKAKALLGEQYIARIKTRGPKHNITATKNTMNSHLNVSVARPMVTK